MLGRDSPRRRNRCCPNGSTMRAGANCSRPSPSCPRTTRPAPSARCWSGWWVCWPGPLRHGAGVTAEFNRNVLYVLNARLRADFDPEAFAHVALWDAENEWIEMRLEATRDMTVTVADLDLTVRFTEGEQMRTEISAKFRTD